jgi:hypothetical protein
MSRDDRFVFLDRQFAELGDAQSAESAEDLALRSYVGRAMGVSSDLGWSAIYRDEQSCVVLGEAGSGKSREMQEQAKALRSTGVVAACIDLRDLLGSTLLIDSDPMLSAWRRGAAVAWFFLDSVDESKLTDVADFHRALKRMAVWVGADSRRARFVISSRISEWRPATDKRLVEETLLPAASKLRVLTLLPLDEKQVRTLLAGQGTIDERFFSDVEEADAWDFLHRPLDVSNLYALWQNQRRLGTLREVVDHSITQLLQDPQRPSLLAANRLREGAEHVAACLTFGKSVAALVPDSVLPDANDALHLRSCLPQAWPDADVRLLAQCPLFDAAAYGKIRFHHRSYQTYLTASWLARLMRSDCPYAELRHLLFGQGLADQLILRPSLDAVAAWLTCLNEGETHWQAMLRSDLLRHAPWVFFAHGDPRSLSLEYRAKLLRRTAEHFKGRNRVQVDWDRPTLKRFADPGLAQQVASVIADAGVSSDLRSDYLMLVRYGKLMEALPSVVAVAIDAQADEALRATAMSCIAEIGLLHHRRQVLAAFEGCAQISLRLGVQLVQVTYPQVVDECGLFLWLGRMQVGQGRARSSSLYVLDHFIKKDVAVDRVLPLLEQLGAFLRDDLGQPRQDRAWAGDWLALLAVRALGAPCSEPYEQGIVLDTCGLIETLRALHWLKSWRDEDAFKDLSNAITGHAALRREWYWRKVAKYRVDEGKEPYAIWDIYEHDSPMRQGVCDLGWLTEDVRSARPLVDRQFPLRSALALCVTAKGRRPVFPPRPLLRAASVVPGLRSELLKHVWRSSTGPWYKLRREWTWHWSKGYWWGCKLNPLRERYWNARNRLQLWRRRVDLAQGRWFDGVWFVIERARAKQGVDQLGSHDVAGSIARYGMTVVDAVMAGADRLWRQHRPDLPHEKPQRNEISAETILGLVALQFAWQESGVPYFQALTREEAETAARYALDELNGLPPWFPELANVHLQAVAAVVTLAVEGEWRTTAADAQFSAPTLRRLVSASDKLPPDLGKPTLRALLMGPPPASKLVLHEALHLVLVENPGVRALLALRAAAQLDGVDSIGESDWPWLICLFLTDADQALNIVERIFSTLDASRRDEMAIALCANLSGDSRGGLSCVVPDFERPAFLRRLIPWVYRYVRPTEDAVHDGVFSPDSRDNAATFRGGLFGRLDAQDGDEVEAVLAELVGDPQLSGIRDLVLHRIDQRKVRRADQYTIEPGDLERLLDRQERVPRNRADLFHLATARLGKFKEEVESAEISIRRECGEHWTEPDFQDWFQRRLRAAANGLYTLSSETKIDPGKFLDLRFDALGVDGAVSVEAKVATFDHWSYATLEERLRNQLVGQYLRALNARHGVYLLIRAKADRHWVDHDGTKLLWPELLVRLQAVADAIVAERPDIDHVRVVGIDVTPPVLAAGR